MSNDLMGVVLFGEPAQSTSQNEVAEALSHAGMPEKLGQHLSPRSWFIRATRELAKTLPDVVLRDLCGETQSEIHFAFIGRSGDENPDYRSVCRVVWNKETNVISCPHAPAGYTVEAVLQSANDLLDSAKSTWSPSDLNALVKRFLGTTCRQVPLRPGVSYIAAQHAGLAEQVQKFYDHLRVPYYRLDVGYTPALARQFHEAIIRDLKAKIGGIAAEIQRLIAAGALTDRKAKARLLELRESLREYKELAQSSRLSAEEMLELAGESGKLIAQSDMNLDILLASAQTGIGKICEPLIELYLKTEDNPEILGQLAALQTPVILPCNPVDLADLALPEA